MNFVFLLAMAVIGVFLFVITYLAYRDARAAQASGNEQIAGLHYIATSILVSFGCLVLTVTLAYAGIQRRISEEQRLLRALVQERQR